MAEFTLSEAARAALASAYGANVAHAVQRFEDRRYLADPIRRLLEAHVPPEALASGWLLDFGCGSGASSCHVAADFPGLAVFGVELDPSRVEAAGVIATELGLANVRFAVSPDPSSLPELPDAPRTILLNAVVEHLLPAERPAVLGLLWRALAPGGVLALTETPHRWFPRERHTTGLWGINFLPDALAGAAARRFSRRVRREASWPELLRDGIRGATLAEVAGHLAATGPAPERVQPRGGASTLTELWLQREGGRGVTLGKRTFGAVAGVTERWFGEPLLPSISGAFRKPGI